MHKIDIGKDFDDHINLSKVVEISIFVRFTVGTHKKLFLFMIILVYRVINS